MLGSCCVQYSGYQGKSIDIPELIKCAPHNLNFEYSGQPHLAACVTNATSHNFEHSSSSLAAECNLFGGSNTPYLYGGLG